MNITNLAPTVSEIVRLIGSKEYKKIEGDIEKFVSEKLIDYRPVFL